MGREIQRDYGQPPQAVITHPLLVGTDGVKMSKSLANGVGITDAPDEMFGKLMSVSDPLMLEYFDLLADESWDELRPQRDAIGRGEGNPMELKLALARALVVRFHGPDAAGEAEDQFRAVVQRKQVPSDLEEIVCETEASGRIGLLALLDQLGLVASRSEARRLVAQNAVHVNDQIVDEPTLQLAPGSYLLKVGKRRYARVRLT
jgi:tyrosyl-tRNA synthetase